MDRLTGELSGGSGSDSSKLDELISNNGGYYI